MLYEETEDFRHASAPDAGRSGSRRGRVGPEVTPGCERYNEQSLPVVLDAWWRSGRRQCGWLRELVGLRAGLFVRTTTRRWGQQTRCVVVGWELMQHMQISALFRLAERQEGRVRDGLRLEVGGVGRGLRDRGSRDQGSRD